MLRPSPGPAEGLPPTLTPCAVALAAPRPDRVKSLLVACAIYAALGGCVLGTARKISHRPTVAGSGPVVWEMPLEPEARPRPEPVRTTAGGPRPAGFTAVLPRADENVVPDRVTALTDMKDRSHEVAGDPAAPVGPPVIGLPPGPAVPEPPRPDPQPSAPVEISASAVSVLSRVDPVYPSLARLVKAQGPVEMRIIIDAQGVPTDVRVVSGPHPLLTAEAVRVARLWRFRPATFSGQAVPGTFLLTVTFRLER